MGTGYRSLQDLDWKASRKWNRPLSNGNSIQLISKIVSRKFEHLLVPVNNFVPYIYTQIFLIISHIDIKKLSFTFIQTLSLSLQCCILCELSSKRNSRLPKSFSFITRREKREKEKDHRNKVIRYAHSYYWLLFPEEMATPVFAMTRLQGMTLIFGHSSATR